VKQNITPSQLIVRLSAYFIVVCGTVIVLAVFNSDALRFLPFGGIDALGSPDIEITETSVRLDKDAFSPAATRKVTPDQLGPMIMFLATTLLTTVLVMIPITWTYMATRHEVGPSKVFVRTLMLMPICATTVVLLIQDSLALAFGLAALVAAVRFRVTLTETIDGIYIFAAICVGLAGGIGHMGVALIMAMIFTLTNAVLWQIDYGRNPIDDARLEIAAAKLVRQRSDQS
jgi:hypothetical protein